MVKIEVISKILSSYFVNYLSVGVAWVDFELKMRQFLSGICITRDRGVRFRSGGGGHYPERRRREFCMGVRGHAPHENF